MPTSTRNARWLLLAIFILAVAARLLAGPRTIDDAYITYRYARNILAGNGFLYNPGEQVLGTTTPLYTFLMVILAIPTGGQNAPFPQLALCLNAVADGITCLLLFHLGKRLGSALAGLGAALVWAIAPFSVTFAIGGLETSVYVLLLTGAVSAHLQERHILAAFLAGLALLTRPDALILLGPLALDRLWQIIVSFRSPKFGIRNSKLETLVFLLLTFPWFLFATLYYGSPLPHSIAAKTLAYHLDPGSAFIRLLQHYATPFVEHLTFGNAWIAVGLVLYPFLCLLGALRAWRAALHSWPFLVYPWLYLITFALANPLIFRWYLTPPLPAYILVILLGLERGITELGAALARITRRKPAQAALNSSRLQPGPILSSTLTILVIVAPVALSLRDWQLHPDHGLDRPAPSMAWYKLELLYRQAAEQVAPKMQARRQQTGQATVLAAGDVGVLGYFTPARILDTVGLNSPQSTRYYPTNPEYYVINYAIPPDLILDAAPDYIIILEVYGRAGLLKEPRFWEAYALIQKLPTDIYGSDGMLILERKN